MKGAALQKELDMRKQFEETNVKHSVELAKVEWEYLAGVAGRAEALQPEAKPLPAPGFEAPRSTPEPSAGARAIPEPSAAGQQPTAQGIKFHPLRAAVETKPNTAESSEPTEGVPQAVAAKLDPWAVALTTPKAGVPLAAPQIGVRGDMVLHTEELMPGETLVLGEPLRNPHPKEFDKPKQYNGSSDGWTSWSESFKDHLFFQDARWVQFLTAVEGFKTDPLIEKHEKDWDREFRLGGILPYKQQLHRF